MTVSSYSVGDCRLGKHRVWLIVHVKSRLHESLQASGRAASDVSTRTIEDLPPSNKMDNEMYGTQNQPACFLLTIFITVLRYIGVDDYISASRV
jgi:hypothetical protein